MTDALLHSYFGITPPHYLTATTTLRLPIERPQVTASHTPIAGEIDRSYRYHPERLSALATGELRSEFAELAGEKNRLLDQIGGPSRRQSREQQARLQQLNTRLAELLTPHRQWHARAVARMTAERQLGLLLGSREFSFCLFPQPGLIEEAPIALLGLNHHSSRNSPRNFACRSACPKRSSLRNHSAEPPDKRNALTRQMLAELPGTDDFHGEKRMHSMILTGKGPAFCAGWIWTKCGKQPSSPTPAGSGSKTPCSIATWSSRCCGFPSRSSPRSTGQPLPEGWAWCWPAIWPSPRRTGFGLPEPRRGIVAGMVTPLSRLSPGAAAAANLLLRGCQIDAAEAHRIGLVAQIAEDPDSTAQGPDRGNRGRSSEAVQLTKKLLNETIGENIFTQLSAGAATTLAARTTSAAKEGLAAFNEKRPPKWD